MAPDFMLTSKSLGNLLIPFLPLMPTAKNYGETYIKIEWLFLIELFFATVIRFCAPTSAVWSRIGKLHMNPYAFFQAAAIRGTQSRQSV